MVHRDTSGIQLQQISNRENPWTRYQKFLRVATKGQITENNNFFLFLPSKSSDPEGNIEYQLTALHFN
jgi:hypothetical protein